MNENQINSNSNNFNQLNNQTLNNNSPANDFAVQNNPEPVSAMPINNFAVQNNPEPVSAMPINDFAVQNNPEPVSAVPINDFAVQNNPEPVSAVPINNFAVQNNSEPVSAVPINNFAVQNNPEPINQYTQNINNTNFSARNSKEKGNKKSKKIILIIILMIIVGTIIFIGYKYLFSSKPKDKKIDIYESNVFFLENSDNKYALFNEDGKQLTDYIYTYTTSFINGTASVEKDNEEGIIDENGRDIVPFGKYKFIDRKGGLYSVREESEDSYNRYLINGKGEILYNLDNIDITTFIGVDTYMILENEEESKYTVLNYKGQELVSFPKIDDDDIEDPSTSDGGNYISVFYNNQNWVFNIHTGNQLANFDSNLHYCINQSSEDGNIVILNSCVEWYEKQDEVDYKIIRNNKLYDKPDECDRIREEKGELICIQGQYTTEEYLLDDDLKLEIKISDKTYHNIRDSYAMKSTKNTNDVDFYQNGDLVKSVSCMYLYNDGYREYDIYLLKAYSYGACRGKEPKYEYYNSKGEKIIDKSFEEARDFDSNGLAEVSDDKKTYYMIDKSGKKVGNSYASISFGNGFYIVENSHLEGIMNKEGKEIVPMEYSEIQTFDYKENILALLETQDGQYIVYDLTNNKKLFSSDYKPDMYLEHYIESYSNGKTQYYTFQGKMFYER